MKIAFTIVIIAVLGMTGYFLMNKNESNTMVKEDTAMMQNDEKKTDEKMAQEEDAMMEEDTMMGDSRYVTYTMKAFNTTNNTKRVLFFYANWCPTCIPADKNFQDNKEQIPENVTLIRVNYNDPETDQDEKDLAEKYNITYQHTFVQIDTEGNEVAQWNGGQIEELLAMIK
ncbi:MAG: thioredoxin family protein [Candidatus Roizmanbacteria bacterium]|nr:thioredoxin family protein [Candidatus Roizmanbacteria bacterium]